MKQEMTVRIAGEVESVTRLRDVVYVLCSRSSSILRFDAVTHRALKDVELPGLVSPHDIAACQRTRHLYVADFECVWRASEDGATVQRWLPGTPPSDAPLRPWTLSVTWARLLVTSPETKELIQFDDEGRELCRVRLPPHILPRHAVESPAGAFILSFSDTTRDRDMVSVVNDRGEFLHRFSGSHLRWPNHVDVDAGGTIFLADCYSGRVLLLDARLALRRVIVDERQLNYKSLRGLCYVRETGHLLVALDDSIAVFDLLCP